MNSPANQKEIDAIVKRAWKAIHDGTSGCIDTAVEEYLNKYRRYIHKAAPAQVKKLTGKRVQEALRKTTESAGGMDGWSPKELSYLSAGTCEVRAVMLNQIEEGAPWPKSAGHARIVFLEKEGSPVGKVMSYRPLTISVPIYRAWASMRLEDCHEWTNTWALHEMYAGVPGKGATDAWYEALTMIESYKLEQQLFCGKGVADIAKFVRQAAKATRVQGSGSGWYANRGTQRVQGLRRELVGVQ